MSILKQLVSWLKTKHDKLTALQRELPTRAITAHRTIIKMLVTQAWYNFTTQYEEKTSGVIPKEERGEHLSRLDWTRKRPKEIALSLSTKDYAAKIYLSGQRRISMQSL